MSKKYVLVGGGSGGHITPLLAVAEELKKIDPTCSIIHVGSSKDQFNDITRDSQYIDTVLEVQAGKFRRYHGESLVSHILDIKTVLKNIRDFFKTIFGVLQSYKILKKIKPDSVLMKGGFVCVPVGIASRLTNSYFITHDSDVSPGLANRIISRWAKVKAHGMPLSDKQNKDKLNKFVGIPLQKGFIEVNLDKQNQYKRDLNIVNVNTVFVVGGGLGARNVNRAMVRASRQLIERTEALIIHVTGKKLFEETKELYINEIGPKLLKSNIRLIDFTTNLHVLSGASDVVVCRAGATNLAEFAVQGKACIVIPNPVLTGGQQLLNSKVFSDFGAIEVVNEEELTGSLLQNRISDLLLNPEKRETLKNKIVQLAKPDAAYDIALILINKPNIDEVQ